MLQIHKGINFRVLFFLLVLFGPIVLLFSVPRLLAPIGIAYVLTVFMRPAKRAFSGVELRKKLLAIFLMISAIFVVYYPLAQGVKAISEEAHRVEYYYPKLENYLREKYSKIKIDIKNKFNYEMDINPVDRLVEFGQESTKSILIYLPQIVASILEWGFMIPLFLFFMMKDGRSIRNEFLRLTPNQFVERTYFLFHQFNTKFGDYIFAKFIEATLIGAVITTGLVVVGYPFAFLLGLLAAITNILPYIGPVLGFIPALIIGLVDQNPNTTIGAMIMVYAVANIIDLALVFPILVSKIVNLHPIVVVISVILGSQFAGAIGMIVSIPFAAFAKLIFDEIYRELYSTHHI